MQLSQLITLLALTILASCTTAPSLDGNELRKPTDAASRTSETSDGLEITKENEMKIKHIQRPCSQTTPNSSADADSSHSVAIGVTRPVGKKDGKAKTRAFTSYDCIPAKK